MVGSRRIQKGVEGFTRVSKGLKGVRIQLCKGVGISNGSQILGQQKPRGSLAVVWGK